MSQNPTINGALGDAQLVAASLAGNRDAFAAIVGRYESLLCSLAYSATGRLSQSEDLAQEAFLSAWKHLPTLRDPSKLRPWLCQIARRRIADALHRQSREPSHEAAELDSVSEAPSGDRAPLDQTISNEESALLWRSLQTIPETYREPLVLFYREGQSIQNVAASLELTEEAVKQRLSRGRKLLQREVRGLVEGALRRTSPGRAFTIGVIAALPVFSASAAAATFGATAAQGSAAAKASGWLALSGAVLGPLIGLVGAWFGVKTSLAQATSEEERKLIVRFTKWTGALVILFLAAMGGSVAGMRAIAPENPWLAAGWLLGMILAYCAALLAMILRFNILQRRVRLKSNSQEAANHASSSTGSPSASPPFTYRSRASFLGIPLINIQLSRRPEDKLRPVCGWIAVGDFAVGILFAGGGITVGGLSMGGVSLGVVSLAGMAIGGLAMGGLALGGWALGGAAAGYLALAGCAVGWQAASGGLAVAKHFAVGGAAHAEHANDAMARAFIDHHGFFQQGLEWISHSRWIVFLCLIPVVMNVWQAVQRKKSRRTNL